MSLYQVQSVQELEECLKITHIERCLLNDICNRLQQTTYLRRPYCIRMKPLLQEMGHSINAMPAFNLWWTLMVWDDVLLKSVILSMFGPAFLGITLLGHTFYPVVWTKGHAWYSYKKFFRRFWNKHMVRFIDLPYCRAYHACTSSNGIK